MSSVGFVWRMMSSRLWWGYALGLHFALPISDATVERWWINTAPMHFTDLSAEAVASAMQPSIMRS